MPSLNDNNILYNLVHAFCLSSCFTKLQKHQIIKLTGKVPLHNSCIICIIFATDIHVKYEISDCNKLSYTQNYIQKSTNLHSVIPLQNKMRLSTHCLHCIDMR